MEPDATPSDQPDRPANVATLDPLKTLASP